MKIKYLVHIWRRSTQGSNKKNTVIHSAIDFESPIIVIIVIVDFLGGLDLFLIQGMGHERGPCLHGVKFLCWSSS